MTGDTTDLELSLVIPFYNEESNVETVTRGCASQLLKKNVAFELVLVNNGSHDKTDREIDRMVREYGGRIMKKQVVAENQGYGWGVITGLRACRGRYVGYMVGDGQVKPSDILKVYDAVKTNPSVVAKTCRSIRYDGQLRLLLSRVYNALARLLHGLATTDVNGSPKMFKRELVDTLDLRSKGDSIDCELLIKAKILGLTVFEVRAVSPRRFSGESNVNIWSILVLLLDLLRFRFSADLLRFKQRASLQSRHVSIQ